MTSSPLSKLADDEPALAHPKPNGRARRKERQRIAAQSKSERSKLEREASLRVKHLVRARDRYRCRLCAEPAYEVAHGFGEKAHPSARWVSQNLATACRRCHDAGHAHPTRWLRAFEILLGRDVFERVKRIAQTPGSGPSAGTVIELAKHAEFWELP